MNTTIEKHYPTDSAWSYFTQHQDCIREVCERFLPSPKMEIPNTRVAVQMADGQEIETDQRGSMPLPVRNLISDFDAAVLAKDSVKLTYIMNDAWLRLPEDRSVYRIPGVTAMCNLLDCTVEGFFTENGPNDNDEEEGTL